MKRINKQNSKHKILNTNKGITLIALVITIIVMLILVSVTISMAVNGGLFNYAGKAVGETQNAINAEQQLSKGGIIVDETYYSSIDEYLEMSQGSESILNPSGTIPEGASYYRNADSECNNMCLDIGVVGMKCVKCGGDFYSEGILLNEFPETVENYDMFIYKNYKYMYYENGWEVYVTDMTQEYYGPILESIKGIPVVSMNYTYADCTNLKVAPTIPSSVTEMNSTFAGCEKLTTAPIIPEGVTDMQWTFSECVSLTMPPEIPNSVTNMYGTFAKCENLTTAPVLPNNLSSVYELFWRCTALKTYVGSTDPDYDFSGYIIPEGLTNMNRMFVACNITKAPKIPKNVTTMDGTFYACTALTTAPDLPESVETINELFRNCTSLKTYEGSTNSDYDFSGYTIPDSVTDMREAFINTKIVTAPVIPSNVTDLQRTFSGCTALTGTITINTNKITNTGSYNDNTCYECFKGVDMTNITLTGSASKTVLNRIGGTGNNWTTIE